MAEEIHGLLEREPDRGQDDTASARSGGAAPERVHGDAPLREQPLGDVDAVPVLLAPGAELARSGIHVWREMQPPRLQLELGGERRGCGIGRPQFGLPRLRVRATGIAMGPDHTLFLPAFG